MWKIICSLLCLSFPAWSQEVFQDCDNCPQMVNLGDFAISRYEITFAEWKACPICRQNIDDHGWGKGAQPVINVSYNDALTYVRWLSSVSGRNYRLPLEAEWEKAAKAGTRTRFWWGDDKGQNMTNCRDCGSPWDGVGAAPVGSFPPNPWRIHDMNGNLWEWTASCWEGEYSEGAALPPSMESNCPLRVIKGGSWYYYSPMATATSRAPNHPDIYSYGIGIRVVRD